MPKKKMTLLAPGFQVRSKVAIYYYCHHTLGPVAWQKLREMEWEGEYGNIWLEYAPAIAWEHWEDDQLVEVAGGKESIDAQNLSRIYWHSVKQPNRRKVYALV